MLDDELLEGLCELELELEDEDDCELLLDDEEEDELELGDWLDDELDDDELEFEELELLLELTEGTKMDTRRLNIAGLAPAAISWIRLSGGAML